MNTQQTFYGYDGGDSEQELIKAANDTLDEDQSDTILKIKQRYWTLGAILETAKARGYCKRLGVKGWIATNLKCSHTHAYQCMKAWKNRHNFDAAVEWYKTSNTPWRPKAATGPTFANEVVDAWRRRDKPEPMPRTKKETLKDAVESGAKWKVRYERIRDELKRWSEQDSRESLVLNQIEAEIAEEEGPLSAIAEPEGKATLLPKAEPEQEQEQGPEPEQEPKPAAEPEQHAEAPAAPKKKQARPRQKKAQKDAGTALVTASHAARLRVMHS